MSGVKQQEATVTLADDTTLDLVVRNPDMVRFDMTRAKHKWPSMDEAPMLWATFVTWRAAVREGVYGDTWENWSDRDCLSVSMEVDEDDADPTDREAGPASV